MKTRAARLYDKKDIRVESFELPEIKDDEILVKVFTDSICMSTYKAAILGSDHKRVPEDINENPIIVGHEFAGVIEKIGNKWSDQFKPGQKFAIQPALNYKGSMASPGYSYVNFGGAAEYTIIPHEVMELGCLLEYNGDSFFEASLAEPLSCVIGAFHSSYHTKNGDYNHYMGIKEGGNMALLAAAGPMGLGAIDYIIHCDRRPSKLVVADINQERLDRAASLISQEEARKNGVEIHYVNIKGQEDVEGFLKNVVGGDGYDDVFVYAPIEGLIETGDRILRRDGCLNFFAGPTDNKLSAKVNFYNVHYASTHVMGTTGGNTDDMKEALDMTSKGALKPAVMVTHIGGLNACPDATLNLPNIPGGKKLIYNHIDLELTAIEDFEEKGKINPLFKELADITKRNNGLWSYEAEKYLLGYFGK